MKKLYLFWVVTGLLVLTSCENEAESSFGKPVDFRVNIASFDKELVGALNTKTFTSPRAGGSLIGYGGLLLVRSPFTMHGYSILDLYAFDLACPNEKRHNIRVTPDNEGKAECKTCGSVFDLRSGEGNVISGPSANSLVRYPVYYKPNEQGEVFHIYAKY